MSLWLCLRFPRLPLQCLSREESRPVAVVERQRVVCHNDCAAALGIRRENSVATARALAGEAALALLERQVEREQHYLEQLCHWAYGITPHLHPRPPDSLLLEIGGCLTLFGGLPALLEGVHREQARRGLLVASGLATTAGAAWLLSHAPHGLDDLSEPLETRLSPLPLEHLAEAFPAAVAGLQRTGCTTLGNLLALPEAALARRCGRDFVGALRRILGRDTERHPDYRPPAQFRDSCQFDYEVQANEELLPAMQQLLQSLGRFLQQCQLATRAIRWELDSRQGCALVFTVRSSSPQGDPGRWLSLTRLQLEREQLKHGADQLTLRCEELESLAHAPRDLFGAPGQREALEDLLDRLCSRLGRQAVSRIACRDEHLPELALHLGHAAPGPLPEATGEAGPRPFWLLPAPRPLALRGGRLYWQGPLQLLGAAERIEDGWWQTPVSRDYYLTRGSAGQYYWVFRDRLGGGWYLHGIFA